MASVLIITSIENLQDDINCTVEHFSKLPGIYVSLNRTQKSTEEILEKHGIDTAKLFFIDCVTTEKTKKHVLHISPNQLDLLSTAIKSFINEIEGEKFLIVDALSTLLIYNNENEVVKFTQKVTEYASRHNVKVIAFNPKTKGEELLDKIYNFFDDVKRNSDMHV